MTDGVARMGIPRMMLLATVTMFAFAGNSLLTRFALLSTTIDASTFTFVRIVSGALMLNLLVLYQQRAPRTAINLLRQGTWGSAMALVAYAAGFTLAYRSVTAATGALLLFGAVQVTMIGVGIKQGERLRLHQVLGLVLSVGGLVWLLLPGLETPTMGNSLLMIAAGIGWGMYSLRGQRANDPLPSTAGNFLRAVPLAAVFVALSWPGIAFDQRGVALAVISGAITSGLGYALWYRILPLLRTSMAASLQLSVPVITAVCGAMLLGEALTLTLTLAGSAVLGGIGLMSRQ